MDFLHHPLLRTDSYGKIFLYNTHEICACVPRHRIQMSEPVNPTHLLQAVKDALLRFPYLMVGIEATRTQYVYRLLTQDPVVLPFDGHTTRYTIGSQDTNGYLFLVGYHGNEIFMEYQHSISDGRGFEEFIRCVLFNYLRHCGYAVENDGTVRTLDTFYSVEESEDAYQHLDEHYSDAGIYQKPEALHADALSDLGDAPEIVTEVTFSFRQLRTVAHEYGVSPLSILSPLFCRAFYAKFGNGSEKPVIAQIPVDLHPYIPSITNRYFICFLDLPYEAAYEQLPLPEVFRNTKRFLEEQMNPELLLFRAKGASSACAEMHERDIPLAEKEQAARALVHNFVHADSFLITNVGQFKLPDCMHPYVLDYGAVLPSASQPFGVLISSYGGKMKISIAQHDHDMQVCSKFIQLLGEIGVEASMHSYPFVVTRFNGQEACPKY
ncbi:MAG: hypothetical protein KH319_00850 [Butyricicoccus pullicaecorum]|nr:hypothetical protein [Butyricicoccus pullicaecorum]